MIEQMPILVAHWFVFHGSWCILFYVSPLLFILYFIKENRIFLFNFLDFLNLFISKLLTTLILLYHSLKLPIIIEVTQFLPSLHKFIKLRGKLVLSFLLSNFWKILYSLLEWCVRIDVVMAVFCNNWIKSGVLIPKVVLLIVEMEVFYFYAWSFNVSLGFVDISIGT